MQIAEIRDDFDLEKIMESGQCFRVAKSEDETYRFITGRHVLRISRCSEFSYQISCSGEEWDQIWYPYFDLNRCYSRIREENRGKNAYIDRCMERGRGLRVLKQDPWEMLISFIISQRKSIPAISRSVEQLCRSFGEELFFDEEDVFCFPEPEALVKAQEWELSACSLGYRLPYVEDAARLVHSGNLPLTELNDLPDDELITALKTVHGVGTKIANCIALFGYGRYACAPVDVWIGRVIKEECGGSNPFPDYGESAGIIQQYVFYGKRKGA